MKTRKAPPAASDSTAAGRKNALASSGRLDPAPSTSEHTPHTKVAARLENKIGDPIRRGSTS